VLHDQIVRGELERQSQVNGGRPAVLGLFGRGGMGKTLLCKALCNHFREEYAGPVCHVECSKSSGSLELQKLILEELTDANKTFLPNLRTSEAVREILEPYLSKAA
jgi:Cdc6-like AAA superfamily ATPase